MIPQFKMLLSVKKLREDKAMRALQKARTELRKAEEREAALTAEVEESARTLPAREQALFDEIIRQVVDMGDVDDTKARVLALNDAHRRLSDRRDRAAEHVLRCQEKLHTARVELQRCQAEVEKTDTILTDLIEAFEEEIIAKEEAEVEDLFTRPRGMAAMAAEGAG